MANIKIIKPKVVIETKFSGVKILKTLEKFGRLSHKSEKKITKDSYRIFLKKLLNWGHESILEHVSISVRFICDRGVTHELVRHRLAAYTQESTRYCNYSGNIQFIEPLFYKKGSEKYKIWYQNCQEAAKNYNQLIELGSTPEEARSVLPNSLKTEIVATFNLREWRHVFEMRTQKAAHPQIREIMIPTLKIFQQKIPLLFDDFVIKEDKSLSYPFYAEKDLEYWQK
ncbi:MAG: FAD-dependent thymidylate synthase [Parcubacteria group bacterium]|nr:FAD-dependent thymidylate synthase [Parcubacteria group bacterium]